MTTQSPAPTPWKAKRVYGPDGGFVYTRILDANGEGIAAIYRTDGYAARRKRDVRADAITTYLLERVNGGSQ